MNVFSKVFGTRSQREVKRIMPLVEKTESYQSQMQQLTDEQLRDKTREYKKRLAEGATLDDLLPEAFATVREAAKRVLGMEHYRVQIIGGIILHQGRIAEMKTGEGKTLVSTLPAYLNALEGKGVHIVTVNDYLAKRDAEWMGKVHEFLGLTVGVVLNDMKPEERRAAYGCDITYVTNNELGFDYLRDNMVIYKEQLVQRDLHYCIIDEIDSVLIDEARTPLIISGQSGKSTKLYEVCDILAQQLERGEASHEMTKMAAIMGEEVIETGDFVVNEKDKIVNLTEQGIKKVEKFFNIENLADPENLEIQHNIILALRAHNLMHKDQDYVVKDDEILIVDEFTGRIMPGRRYSDGLHQAIEAKEHVKVKRESKTLATITFQNFFNKYDKKGGMTGTALTEEKEFRDIYGMDVVEIPTNRVVQRKDLDDAVYMTKKEKFNAVVEAVKEAHAKHQPVLVGTITIETSELLSRMLKREGIPHNVLNAKFHELEAEIVAQAGQADAVTIATNMAGRGTDIMLGGNVEFLADAKLKSEGYSPDDTPDEYEKRWPGTLAEIKDQVKDEHEEVVKLGGLYVLGTERHESRRIDNQLRGRSGRQGDPGESRFYLSLEDDLMRLFNTQLVARVMAKGMPEGEPIEAKSVSKGVRTAQKAVESRNFEIRKNVLKYDDVMNKQRTVIYAERQAVLKGADIHEDILKFIDDTVLSYIKGANNGSDKPADWDWDGLFKAISSVYPIAVEQEAAKDAVDKLKGDKAVEALKELIVSDAKDQYSDFEDKLGSEGLRQLERRVVLAVLDRKWREHLYEMDYLKDGIGLRGMGQRDPLVEYQREGYQMYNSMIEAIKEETIQLLFHVDIERVAMTEDEETESDEDEAVNAAEAVMGLDGEAAATGESAPAEPETDDEAEKTTIDELADEQKNEKGIVGMQPISHAEGKVPANKRPKSEELHSPWADGRTFPGTGKNAQCPCGSGRKYKMCHGQNEQ